jgi:hypothetical protein
MGVARLARRRRAVLMEDLTGLRNWSGLATFLSVTFHRTSFDFICACWRSPCRSVVRPGSASALFGKKPVQHLCLPLRPRDFLWVRPVSSFEKSQGGYLQNLQTPPGGGRKRGFDGFVGSLSEEFAKIFLLGSQSSQRFGLPDERSFPAPRTH